MELKQLKDLNQGDIFKIIEGKLKEELFIYPDKEIRGWQDNYSRVISIKTGTTIKFKDDCIVNIIKYNLCNNISLELITIDSKLQLVKAIKELTGWGLKESKDYMDENLIEYKDALGTILKLKVIMHNIDYIQYMQYDNDNVIINKL